MSVASRLEVESERVIWRLAAAVRRPVKGRRVLRLAEGREFFQGVGEEETIRGSLGALTRGDAGVATVGGGKGQDGWDESDYKGVERHIVLVGCRDSLSVVYRAVGFLQVKPPEEGHRLFYT